MNTTSTMILSLTALCCAAVAAVAQQQPAPTAQSEAGEPRADTLNPAPASAAPATPASAAPATKAAKATGASTPGPSGVAAANAGTPAAGRKGNTPAKIDRLDLGTATVTGDREQPKVLYIVPWKRSDIGDLAGKPMNSLVDEILAPVDRDVFKREVVYYRAVQSDASQNGAPLKPAQQGEK